MQTSNLMEQAKKRNKFWKRHQTPFIVGMLSVAVINFAVFWLYVNFSSILMAFESPGIDGFTLINFENAFKEFTMADSVLPNALVNTLKCFVVALCITTPASLFCSYFLFKKIALYKFFRIVFFLPSIINVVVMTCLFSYMASVNPEGILTIIVQGILGLDEPPILFGDSRYAMNTIILYNIWTGLGVNIILFSGAMARIPEDVIEYGRLEGLGFTRELLQVVAPMIWPTISTVLTLAIVGLFNSSGPILFFTKGAFDTYTISYWIFDQVYHRGVYEYASAVGLIFTFIGLPIALLAKWGLGKVGTDVEY